MRVSDYERLRALAEQSRPGVDDLASSVRLALDKIEALDDMVDYWRDLYNGLVEEIDRAAH